MITNILFLEAADGLPFPMVLTISISVAAVLLLAGFVLYMWLTQEKSATIAREVQRITNFIGAGVINYIAEGEGHIVYASKGFYDIIGMEKDEVKENYNNDFYRLIDRKYSEYLKTIEVNKDTKLNEEMKIITPKGERWILLSGNYTQRNGRIGTISAVIVDITEDKLLNERLLIEQERYRLATELSNDVIINYKMENDTLNISENFKKYYGGTTCIPNFGKNKVWAGGFIYDEDIEVCSELYRILTMKGGNIDQQIRIKNCEGKYVWCRLIAMPVKNAEGLGKEIIGKLINIDMHKRELGRLESKAMRDPLTGAFNKMYTELLINKYIEENPDKSGMLFLIDIDKFKNINDTYGHLMGDNVIIEVVKQLTRAFRSNDIIGRIGGDEFVVFVCDVNSREIQIKQAMKLHEVLRQSVTFGSTVVQKSASIGVAMLPEHGKNYKQLVDCADKALYEVKGNGRDSFRIFGE